MTGTVDIYVVDDDPDFAGSTARLLGRHGYRAVACPDPAAALALYEREPSSCILTDIMMGDINGFLLADRIRAIDPTVAMIFMTGWPTIANAVDAVRRYGGLDYLEKPIEQGRLMNAVEEGVAWSRNERQRRLRTISLTTREREVLELLVQGNTNKVVAALLDVSPKTVEDHRASIMKKTRTNNIAQLIALKIS